MRLSIRTKFLLLISLLLLVIFGVSTVLLIRERSASLRQELFERSRAFATLATQPIGNTFVIYKDSGKIPIDQQVQRFLELEPSITSVAVADTTGKIVYGEVEGLTKVAPERASSFIPVYINDSSGILERVIQPYFEASGAHSYSVVYSVSGQSVDQAVRAQTMSLLAFGGISMLVAITLVFVIINLFIIRPLRRVSAQAAIISAGNLDQQITTRSKDEVGDLSQAVNKMAESLKQNIAELKEVDEVKSEFMMIASHNLRTPLTVINAYLETMGRFANDPQKLDSAIKTISTSVKQLATFAEDVLAISHFELGNAPFSAEPVNIGRLLRLLTNEFRPLAEGKSIHFVAVLPVKDVIAQASESHIRNAIWNVLDNALKFTPEGGKIEFTTDVKEGKLFITITDNGVGIAEEELPKLFTKFHRGTSTLAYDFSGVGIGLYASRIMLEQYGGTISAKSRVGEGSQFVITLPLIAEPAKVEGTPPKP